MQRAVFACVILARVSKAASGVGFMMCSMGLTVGHILVKGQALSSKTSQVKLESAAAGEGKTNRQFMMGCKAAAKSVQRLWMTASMKGLGMYRHKSPCPERELSSGIRICLPRELQKCRRWEGKKSFDTRRKYCQGNYT